jgi:glutamyl-tRNA reductase
MQLVVVGTHQHTAPVAMRERLAFSVAHVRAALQALRAYADEGCILSTCNRVEVYGLVASHEPGDQALRRFLAAWHGIALEELTPHLYTYSGATAVRHVFRLAAGLDSLVLGEDQIMGQLKEALAAAHAAGATGPLMNRLLHSALASGKLVRTRTGLARSHLSVVSVALDLARETLGDLGQRRVLVVGAGRMAQLALKHLRGETPAAVGILNRTPERAHALAAIYDATTWPFACMVEALQQADVVVSCTAAPQIIISADMVVRALARRSEPVLLLDLAVPRDIDRQVAALPNARLFDIDAMQAICEANRAARAAEIARAEALIDGEVAKFRAWWAAQAVTPTIRALRARAEAIQMAELERTLARLPELSPREQNAVRALSAAIVNKLLHQPIATLKNPSSGSQLTQAVQQLFQLAELGTDFPATEPF